MSCSDLFQVKTLVHQISTCFTIRTHFVSDFMLGLGGGGGGRERRGSNPILTLLGL